jgi:glycolate oxidase
MSYHYDERIDGALVTHDKSAVVAQLQARIPDLQLLYEQEDLRPFECDGLAAYRATPMLVALPDKVEQVAALLKFASAQKIPVVARGAGTGLSGGALPLDKGILLVMARFNRILEVDPEAGIARVQPGVRNLWPVLRTGPVVADRLLDRRQRRGKRRRRALPEVRVDRQ